ERQGRVARRRRGTRTNPCRTRREAQVTLTRRIHPEAASELLEAAKWYQAEQHGLGDDFMAEVEEAVLGILDWPHAAPAFPGWNEEPFVRNKRVRVFPYRVVYYITDTSIVIVAYAHARRKPGYWEHRLDG